MNQYNPENVTVFLERPTVEDGTLLKGKALGSIEWQIYPYTGADPYLFRKYTWRVWLFGTAYPLEAIYRDTATECARDIERAIEGFALEAGALVRLGECAKDNP
jgi:hypothetical protein